MVVKKSIEQDKNDLRLLVSSLRKQSRDLFMDYIMRDVNDALTSILAICDTEAPKSTSKVKKYISRINNLLLAAKRYQSGSLGSETFDLNLVVAGVADVIEDRVSGHAKIERRFSKINAPVTGRQKKLENMLISFALLLTEDKEDFKLAVSLIQKGDNAVISISKSPHVFTKRELNIIKDIKDDYGSTLSVGPLDGGIEVSVKLPIAFNIKVDISLPSDIDARFNGAQERT